jgi:AraC family transcriptional regulator
MRLRPAPLGGRQSHALASSLPQERAPAIPATTAPSYQGGHSLRQQQKSWSGVNASVAQMHCDGDLHVDLGADAARLSVVLEEVGGRMEIRANDGRGPSPAGHAARPLSIIPAALPAHGKGNGVRFIRHLVIEFDTATLGCMAQDEIDLTNVFAPRLMFADPGIMHLAQLFAAECGRDAPHARLYGDNLSIALLLALSRLCARPPSTIPRGYLAPWQLRRVCEYLNAHLAEDVALRTLSDLVNLSRSYFSRAFKISTGLSPHQWLLQARIDKAKLLLLDTDRPLAKVALDVGFSDQAHFTRTFTRAIGESPGAWKRTRCE